MATNPSIILSGSNVNDVINDQRAKIAQAQAQQGAQQIQDLQVAQAKQDFQDQQILKQAWRASAGDPTLTATAAAKMGASPKALQAFQASQLKMQNDYADLHKKKVDADKTELDMLDSKHKGFADLLDAPANAAPAEFQPKFNRSLQTALNLGKITPAEAQQYSTYTQEQVKDLQTGFRGALANSEIAKNTAQGNKANSDVATNNATLGGKIADGVIKQKQGLAPELEQAYTTGGADAYAKVLAAKDPTNNLGFAAPDDLKKAPNVASAVAAIRGNATTSEQKIQAEQAATNEANTQAYRGEQLKQGERRLSIEATNAAASQAMAQANLALHKQGMDDREIQQVSAPFNKIVTNAQTQLGTITNAQAQLNSKDGATQFMGMLSALKADVAGGGVRLNNSEYEGIMRARLGGKYAETTQQLTTGKPLSSDQITALKGVMNDLKGVVTGKINDAANAMQDISNAPSQAVRQSKLQWYMRNKFGMEGAVNQPAPAQGGKVLEIGSQKQYDALPSGAIYTENGVKYRKP